MTKFSNIKINDRSEGKNPKVFAGLADFGNQRINFGIYMPGSETYKRKELNPGVEVRLEHGSILSIQDVSGLREDENLYTWTKAHIGSFSDVLRQSEQYANIEWFSSETSDGDTENFTTG